MTQLVKFPGIVKTIGGTEYIIPPISLRTLQIMQSEIEQINQSVMDAKSIDTAITVIHSALKRNYPQITLDEVGDLVDVGSMFDLFEVVMDVSGLKRKAIEEAKAGEAGEQKPNQP